MYVFCVMCMHGYIIYVTAVSSDNITQLFIFYICSGYSKKCASMTNINLYGKTEDIKNRIEPKNTSNQLIDKKNKLLIYIARTCLK